MRAAFATLFGSLLIIGDVSCQYAERVQGGQSSVNDWAFATCLGVGVGLAGAGWVAAGTVPAGRRVSRLTRPIARYGAGAALMCGLGASAAAGISALFARAGHWEFWEDRYRLECIWLLGAALGGLFGSAVGAGLGAAAYGSRRPPVAAVDPEQDNYREGPGGSATEPADSPDPRRPHDSGV